LPNPDVNMAAPVNWSHYLNDRYVGWWMVPLGMSSGSRFTNIANPGPQGLHGVLTNLDTYDAWGSPIAPNSFGSLQGDGDDGYVNLPGSDNDANPNAIINLWVEVGTFACWYKATDTTVHSLMGFFNDGPDSAIRLNINADPSDESNDVGEMQLFMRDEGANTLQCGMTTDTGISDGEDHHLIWTWHSANATSRAWLDGAELSLTFISQDVLGSLGRLEYPLVLAAVNVRGTITDHANAQLDHIQLIQKEFNDADVKNLYQEALTGYPNMLNRIQTPRFVAAAVTTRPYRLTTLGVS